MPMFHKFYEREMRERPQGSVWVGIEGRVGRAREAGKLRERQAVSGQKGGSLQ